MTRKLLKKTVFSCFEVWSCSYLKFEAHFFDCSPSKFRLRAACSLCSAVSCEQCVQSTKCAWNTSDGATMARQQCVPFPTQGQKPGLLPSEPIPIKTHRAPHVCPRPCRSHTSCQSCLSSRGGGEAGLAGCLWSARLSACFSRLHALLRCADGVCGYLAAPPASSCPSEDCSNVTYCRTCLKQRNCGWMGLADGSGTGECVRGSYAVRGGATCVCCCLFFFTERRVLLLAPAARNCWFCESANGLLTSGSFIPAFWQCVLYIPSG